VQPFAQRPGDHGEDDVVDRAAERVLDPFEGGQLRACPREAPVGADLTVERHVGGRIGKGPRDLPDGLQRLHGTAGGCLGVAHGVDRALGELQRGTGQVRGATGEQVGGARRRLRSPAVLDRSRLRDGLGVEEHGADVDPGDAVDRRVMGLGQEREAVALEALYEPHLPERLGAVELLREHPGGKPLQLLLAAGIGQRRVADVVGEVEVDVVGPERPAGLQWRHHQPLAEARHLVELAAHVLHQIDVARRRPLEDQDAADVHMAGGRLVGEERGVGRAESLQVVSRGAHAFQG